MISIMQLSICAILFLGYFAVRPRNKNVGLFLIDTYLLGISIYVVGSTYAELFLDYPNSNSVANIARYTLMSAIGGALIFLCVARNRFPKNVLYQRLFLFSPGRLERACVVGGMLLCSFVMVAFILSVLRNDTIGPLLSIVSISGNNTLTTARKMITSGSEGYFAPGYVKQFRDILPPILVSAFMLYRGMKKWMLSEKCIFLSFVFITLSAQLVSGQRGSIFIFFVVLAVTKLFCIRGGRVVGNEPDQGYFLVVLPILILFVIFGVMSLFLGRVGNQSSLSLVVLFDIVENIFKRIVLASVVENINAFYIWNTDLGRGGAYWLEEIGKVLPGNQGQSLSNELAQANGSSAAGNSPLGLPADLWFTWGWIGLVLFPAIYAFGVGVIDILLHRFNGPLAFGARTYFMIVLPFIFSPYGFLLYGGAVVVMIITGVAFLRKGKVIKNASF